MPFTNQIKRIKEKLPLAKRKDAKLKVFGASKHKYLLNLPLSKNKIAAFEAKNNIQLPAEFKAFLTEVGNGGAGPYYGISKLEADQADEYLSKPCKIHHDLTDQEWSEVTSFETEEGITDERYEEARGAVFQGMLNIGTQGCTYEMMLVVSGEHKGRVVYIDEDLQKPFFTYEANFLDWYERWLDEIIAGYNEINGFGMRENITKNMICIRVYFNLSG